MPLTVLPLTGTLGAEIRRISVAGLGDGDFAAVRQALLDHGVICFRNQDITPEQLLAFARRWGEAHLHPYLSGLPEHPEIIEIVKEPDDPNNFGDHWHTDQIFTPQPATAAMLHAKEARRRCCQPSKAEMERACDTPGLTERQGPRDILSAVQKQAVRQAKPLQLGQ